jgi:hypothetical protein
MVPQTLLAVGSTDSTISLYKGSRASKELISETFMATS